MTEADLENVCSAWFQELGYVYKFGPDIAPRGAAPERKNITQVVLHDRLRDAITRLNPGLPASAIEDAFGRIDLPPSAVPVIKRKPRVARLVDLGGG